MLTYTLAKNAALLRRLALRAVALIVRIEEDCPDSVVQIVTNLVSISKTMHLQAVILGCEPDAYAGRDWTYTSTSTWGQDRAWQSAFKVNTLRMTIKACPDLSEVEVVAPALSIPDEMISEDGVLQPGRTTWLKIVGDTYDECDAEAAHLYDIDWPGVAPALRFKFAFKRIAEERHKSLYIDEVGVVLNCDDVGKMQTFIDLASIILAKADWAARVRLFCLFISAGDPGPDKAWNHRLLVKDEAAYRLLGQYVKS